MVAQAPASGRATRHAGAPGPSPLRPLARCGAFLYPIGVRLWLALSVLGPLAAGLCLVATLGRPPALRAAGAAPKNLVLITLDTTRRDHLGVYGYARDTTPRLDAFARRCIRFDQAITTQTNTAPAHASILTGRYPTHHGLRYNGGRLSPAVPTLAERLAEAGLATGAFVSGWTMKGRPTGLDRGFSRYDDRLPQGNTRDAEGTIDAALAWLRQQAGPYFLFVHLFDAHYPYDAPPPFDRRFPPPHREWKVHTEGFWLPGPKSRVDAAAAAEWIRRYDNEIAYADHHLGRLLDALEARGDLEQTVVVVTADHGETLYERPWIFDHGGRLFEEQVHVPLLLCLPGGRHGGRRIAAPVGHIDLAPTITELFDLPAAPVDGRSLLPLLAGAPWPPRPLFLEARSEPKRVVLPAGVDQAPKGHLFALRQPPYKLILYPKAGGGFHPTLFDLSTDPGETQDLFGKIPEGERLLHLLLDHVGEEQRAPAARPLLDREAEEALKALGYVE